MSINELKFDEYLDDRVIAKTEEGFFVIKPKEINDFIPIKCDVCDFLFRSVDDEKAFLQYQCCDHCSKNFAAPNKDKWLAGWRPTSDMIRKSNENRNPIVFVLR